MEGETMKCSQMKELISRYVDDDLGPDEQEAFTLHIRDCAGCRTVLEEIQAVDTLFDSAERLTAPYGFATRVLARLEGRERSSFWSFLAFHRSVLRAAELVFALMIFVIGVISGNVLMANRASEKQTVLSNLHSSFSLDLFQATPPGSVGGAYVSLMGAADER
jgi:anti-sigma factor RsiW